MSTVLSFGIIGLCTFKVKNKCILQVKSIAWKTFKLPVIVVQFRVFNFLMRRIKFE